jgi:ribonuclease P protein component
MFKRSARAQRADFSVSSRKIRVNGSLFTLTLTFFGENAKFACVVSKKIDSKAHKRNLIKRRTRAAFREMSVIVPGIYIYTARKPAAEASYQDILADLRTILGTIPQTRKLA